MFKKRKKEGGRGQHRVLSTPVLYSTNNFTDRHGYGIYIWNYMADDIYTTVVRIPEKSIYTTVLQIDNA